MVTDSSLVSSLISLHMIHTGWSLLIQFQTEYIKHIIYYSFEFDEKFHTTVVSILEHKYT